MIDDDIATRKHLAQGGMARTALPLPASVGFAAKFMPHHLLDPRSVATALRQPSCCAATELDAPPTEQRAIRLWHAAWPECVRRVLFHRRPAARPGLRLWRAPAQRGGSLRWISPVICRARHPSAKGAKSPTLP